MKSIKEKAKEYGLKYPTIYYDADGNPYDDVENPSTDFEEGAYYVLGEVETITKADLGSYKSQLDRIKNIIEQLKK